MIPFVIILLKNNNNNNNKKIIPKTKTLNKCVLIRIYTLIHTPSRVLFFWNTLETQLTEVNISYALII